MADDSSNVPDFLDQSEIDKLVAQSAMAEAPKSVLVNRDGSISKRSLGKVEAYDFRNPAFLSEIELRRLRLLHEDFIRYVSARLSLFLRMELTLKMSTLTTSTYSKFTESLPNPTHICLFRVEPLAGVGVLDINPRFALTIADRLLGGRGHSVKAERYLTEIETALIEDVIMIILEEWCGQWKSDQELQPHIISHENNGRFLQSSSKDAIVLSMTLEAKLGDCAEQIQLGIPYYTLEPLVKKMQARGQKHSTTVAAAKKSTWYSSYDGITVPVRAEWQPMEMTVRELAGLRVGDVIEMPADISNETFVLINGTPKFTGKVGLDTDHVAVQLNQKLPNEEISHAHSRKIA